MKFVIGTEFRQTPRLTDTARLLLNQCVDRALERGMRGDIPVLLLFWTVLRWEQKVATIALGSCGVDLESVAAEANRELVSLASIGISTEVDFWLISELARNAASKAASLGRDYVASEHLLMAAFESDAACISLMLRFHVSSQKYEAAVQKILDEG